MLAAVVVVLVVPTAVLGDDGESSPQVTGFRLQATNGYEFDAFAEVPTGGTEGMIGIFLINGRRSAVTYAAPATVTASSIDADLGSLGRISVTRTTTGETRTVRAGCKPESTKQVETENYEGTIEFHGEEGFADVSATRAPLVHEIVCTGRSGADGTGPAEKELPGARLDVERHVGHQYRVEFDAIQNRRGARTGVSVEVEEHRDGIEIHRATWTRASAGALRFDRHLRTATVRPPAPFAGHASFDAGAPLARRWSGNLTADLPGHADLPVTGRGFRAELVRPR